MIATWIFSLLAIGTLWGGFGTAFPGAVLAVMAMTLTCCSVFCGPELREFTGCLACCCCCPDCGRFSNAWHIRNAHVALLVMLLPTTIPPLAMGIALSLDQPGCTYECSVPSMRSCSSCGSAVILAHNQHVTHDCCDASSQFPESCDARYPNIRCRTKDDEDIEDWGGCEGMCSCMQGKLRLLYCDDLSHHGNAAIVSSISLCGIVVAACCSLGALNGIIQAEGYEGKPSRLRMTEPQALNAAQPAAVVGWPVVGQPVSVVAPTASRSSSPSNAAWKPPGT